jgi:hypothetical protein
VFTPGFHAGNLLPLSLRTLEIHGMTLGPVGLNGGEANGQPGYKMELPVPSADIQTVPERATFAFSGIGVMLIFAARRYHAFGRPGKHPSAGNNRSV